MDAQAKKTADAFILPPLTVGESDVRNMDLDSSGFEVKTELVKVEAGLEEIQKRALQNLGGLPILKTECSVAELLVYAQSIQARNQPNARLLLITTVESCFHRWAELLTPPTALTAAKKKVKRVAHCLDAQDAMTHLEELLGIYRKAMCAFKSVPADAELQSVLRSRELLVVWTAYCLVFQSAKRTHEKHMGEFGVALRPQDLCHLVLNDKAAWDAALRVHHFLGRESVGMKPLFSFRDHLPTFAFAEAIAGGTPSIVKVWKEEQAAALRRRDAERLARLSIAPS